MNAAWFWVIGGIVLLGIFAPEVLLACILAVTATVVVIAIVAGIYELGRMIFNYFTQPPVLPPTGDNKPVEGLEHGQEQNLGQDLKQSHEQVQEALNVHGDANVNAPAADSNVEQAPQDPGHYAPPAAGNGEPSPRKTNIAHDGPPNPNDLPFS